MKRSLWYLVAAAAFVSASCARTGRPAASSSPAPLAAPPPHSPAALAQADSGRPPYTDADVHFMSGMVAHHAQAVLMAGWAPTHGASPDVGELCQRIVVAQHDEIGFMQRWLRERRLPVPGGDASHDLMPGMHQGEMMPGMLTAEQLQQLDAARGPDFDRLFLTFMIMHHQGAITMVHQLLDAPGALRDDVMFKFASDINADQTAEIDRMNRRLQAMGAQGREP